MPLKVLETNVNYHFTVTEKRVNFDPNEQKTKQIQMQGHKEKASTKHDLDPITQNPNPMFPPQHHRALNPKQTKSKQTNLSS